MSYGWYFSGKRNVKPNAQGTYEEHQNIEDIVKMILKEWKDKDGYKGEGSI